MKRSIKQASKVTIFDVAERASVSIKTVSRVVNREPNVRDETREKVLRAIADLDYRPNAAARGLSSKRSYVIGLIYENADEFSYMKDVLNGALKVCEASGFSLLLRPLTLPNPLLKNQVKQFLVEANIAGVVLPPPIGDIEDVRTTLKEVGVPYTTISPKREGAEVASVHCNDERATFALTEFLLAQGHERIGFIKGHPDHVASQDRLRGYQLALRAHGVKTTAKLVKQGYFDFDSGRQAAGKLLDLNEPPSAILASSDDMAAGAIFEARERKLSIPEDVSIVGFDDTPVASRLWPPLTTVRQPIMEMAESATGLLIKHLQGEEIRNPDSAFDCELVIRESSVEL
jgi:LacI family transcriptional regulator